VHPLKHTLLSNLDNVMDRISHKGNNLQYVTLNSCTSKISFPEHFAKLTEEYQLVVEVVVKLFIFEQHGQRTIKMDYAVVEGIHLFKNDGNDVQEFWFTRNELQDYINYNTKNRCSTS
jgi:hypothetical protein